MKSIYIAKDIVSRSRVASLLDDNGVFHVERNLTGADDVAGYLAMPIGVVEILVNEEDEDKARALLADVEQ